MAESEDAAPAVIALITGGWRSNLVYVATMLGVFEALDTVRDSQDLAARLGVDAAALYRVMRALATLGLVREESLGRFATTAMGDCLRGDHAASLRGMALLEAGGVHVGAWKHLEEIVRSGKADGFRREHGVAWFYYLRRDPAYARTFSEAMSSFSALEAPAIAAAYAGEAFGGATLCDIGGSQGALLAALLADHREARGIVFELPEVVAHRAEYSGAVADRLAFVGGDMFAALPAADVYVLKHILHDWADADCVTILDVARRAARPGARLLICEMLVPPPEEPHFAKLFDVHMMVVAEGRERTRQEMADLLGRAGWRSGRLRALTPLPMSVFEAELVG